MTRLDEVVKAMWCLHMPLDDPPDCYDCPYATWLEDQSRYRCDEGRVDRDAVAWLKKLSGGYGAWTSVETALPPIQEPVLVCRKGKNGLRVEPGWRESGGDFPVWVICGTRTIRVTHWMPLPEPPKE